MAYYDALIAAWNNVTQPPPGVTGSAITGGMTTAQKLVVVNAWTVVGSIPTSFFISSGAAVLNCINFTEFNNLTAAQQSNLIALLANSGQLLGGSGNLDKLLTGMFVSYFVPSMAISSGTYNNGTGDVVLTMGASIKFGSGANSIVVTGLTGTGAFASLNGTFATKATTSGTTVTYNAGAGLGASTITGGSLVPPTIAALTALAKATSQSWWQANGYTSPIGQGDLTAAGLS